jgi:hypothetical protein
MLAPEGFVVDIKPPTRNLEQNSLLWPWLAAISKGVEWYGQYLTDDNWKDILTAALKREKVVPGINGGFVVLGQHTSNMSKKDFSELLELTIAFATQHDVSLPERSCK